MSFHRATLKSLNPLTVLERGAEDVAENRWEVYQTEIHPGTLVVNDEVVVEIHAHQVYLRSRIGGVGVEDPHSDDVEEDVTGVQDFIAQGEMRSMTLSWNPPVGGVGHGYYQVQIADVSDSTYAAPERSFTTSDTLAIVLGLAGGERRARVRPFGGDGTPGAWTEDESVVVRDIISTDIGAGQVNRDAIEQGAIDTLQLADGAVNHKKLVIGSFDNLIQDPGFESETERDPNPVSGGGTWGIFDTPVRSGNAALRYSTVGQVSDGRYRPMGDHTELAGNIATAQADVFYLEAWCRATASGGAVRVGVEFYDHQGALLQSVETADTGVLTAYQRVSVVATAPAGVAYAVPVLIARYSDDGSAGLMFDDLYMRRRVEGRLIVDGTIDAIHLAANSVTALKIAAGAIDVASKITVGAITGDRLAGTTITGDKIATGTITAASGIIADAAITTAKIGDAQVTSAKILSLEAGKISAGTITASISITSPTINGGTFRTASSGSRLEITSGALKSILWYDTFGGQDGSVSVTPDGNMYISSAAGVRIQNAMSGSGGVYSGVLTSANHSHDVHSHSGTVLTTSNHSHNTSGTTSGASTSQTGYSSHYTDWNSNYSNGDGSASYTGGAVSSGLGVRSGTSLDSSHSHTVNTHKHDLGQHYHYSNHLHGMSHTHTFSI